MRAAKSACDLSQLNVDDNEQYRSTRDLSEDNSSNASSSTTSRDRTTSYGLTPVSSTRENHFLSAAKKWAAYDKTPYISPFARDSWKRTHRKFNYSRFLNYTRETFVWREKDIGIENLCELLYISQLNHYKIVSNCREIKTIATSNKRVHVMLEWLKIGSNNYTTARRLLIKFRVAMLKVLKRQEIMHFSKGIYISKQF